MNKLNPSDRPTGFMAACASGLALALSITLGSGVALGAPQLQIQFSESSCGGTCPTPVTYSDGGTGTLSVPNNASFGAFTLKGGQTLGLVNLGSPNTEVLDPNINVLAPASTSAALTIMLTETGLVVQDTPTVGVYFDPAFNLPIGVTATVATYLSLADVAFGTTTPIGLTADGVPGGVTYTNNANGSVTFTNSGGGGTRTTDAVSADYDIVAVSGPGDFSVTEIVTLTGLSSSGSTKLQGEFEVTPPVYAPEPTALALLGSGLACLGLVRGRRRRSGS